MTGSQAKGRSEGEKHLILIDLKVLQCNISRGKVATDVIKFVEQMGMNW